MSDQKFEISVDKNMYYYHIGFLRFLIKYRPYDTSITNANITLTLNNPKDNTTYQGLILLSM